jgi:ribonuclease G
VSDNYIVLLKSAYENHHSVGVSKKIENVSERKRLKKIATDILPDGFEVIIRTECEGISEEEMAEKINELITKYHQIVKRAEFSTAPAAIQKDDYFLANTLRAVLTSDVEKIVIDNEAEFSDVKDAALKIRDVDIKLYTGGIPIFSEHFLTKQIEEAFSRKVWLKSGGFIVIDHAEAGILIDVNSGKFVGKCSQQKTALKVDREALVEIAKQIRLRNLSGMILIDFIDLRFEENRCIIIDELEKELKKDRIPTSIIGMMGQGLVMLTRRKTREPIIGV